MPDEGTRQTYSEVIVYDRITNDHYGTLSQERVHLPSEGDMISLGNTIVERDPGDESYEIKDRESHTFIVTAVDFDYNAVEYRIAGESEGNQLVETVYIAVEPARDSASQ